MNVKNILSLVTGVLECLLFSGLLFGWASILKPLEQDCYFIDLCGTGENSNMNRTTSSTPILPYAGSGAVTDGKVGTGISLNISAVVAATWQTTDVTTLAEMECRTCNLQAERLNLVFTVASTLLSLSTLLNGYIYDKFGTWISRAIAIVLFTIGCVLMIVSSPETSWLLFPSLSCFAIGGILLLVTNLQIGNLFGRLRSSVITMLSGALDSSSFVFLLFKIVYDKGVPLSTIFHVTCWCTVFLWVRTFVLLPRHHIPFPLTKGHEYGIKDCNSSRMKEKGREMVSMSNEKEELDPKDDAILRTETSDDTFMACLKTWQFWTNVLHFSLLQLRNYFFMSSLYSWLKALAAEDQEITNSYLVAFGTCQLFGIVFAPLNGLLIDMATRALDKRDVCKKTVPLKAVTFSGIATSILGTLFSIVIVIPSLPLQYVSFILQVIFRSFLYGGNMSFIAIGFPGKHFGKLYGLTMSLGGLVSLFQYPLFTLVLRQFDGDFFVLNVMFVFVSLITLLHPASVWRHCKSIDKKDHPQNSDNQGTLLT